MTDEKEKKKLAKGVYVPPNAKVNDSTKSMSPPKTEYDKRKATFKAEAVKNLTGGIYGKNGQH